MRRPLAALALLIGFVPAARLPAQASPLWGELVPGERVRIDAPAILAGRLATMVVSRSGDSVKVRARDRRSVVPGEERLDYLTLPLAGITSVEVSRGRSHLLGATVGAVSGALVAVALVALDNERPDVCALDCPDRTRAKNLIKGADVGAVAGGLLGLLIGRERWRRVHAR
jgi:hypothetical protein